MAEAMLAHRVRELGIDARVSSAGTAGDGRGPTPEAAAALAEHDLTMTAHVSRPLAPALLRSSDLVLGMAREHVREVALLAPEVYPRTFTLKELVRRGDEIGPRREAPLGAWLALARHGRTSRAHLGASPIDDVDDPIGKRPAVYERVADELAVLVDQLVALLWVTDDVPTDPNELATT